MRRLSGVLWLFFGLFAFAGGTRAEKPMPAETRAMFDEAADGLGKALILEG